MAVVIEIAQCLYGICAEILRALTKFTTIYMAGSGQGFFEAAMETSRLLRRNMLSTVTVWWVPNAVLSLWTLFLTALWLLACVAIVIGSDEWQSGDDNVQGVLILTLVLQGLLAFGILRFFMMTATNVVDALYIAFALDKD